VDELTAYGKPFDPSRPRWIPCHRGAQWCGWHRMSNSEEEWEEMEKEREEHEETCNGGLMQP